MYEGCSSRAQCRNGLVLQQPVFAVANKRSIAWAIAKAWAAAEQDEMLFIIIHQT